jgi:hypothetical protein
VPRITIAKKCSQAWGMRAPEAERVSYSHREPARAKRRGRQGLPLVEMRELDPSETDVQHGGFQGFVIFPHPACGASAGSDTSSSIRLGKRRRSIPAIERVGGHRGFLEFR